MPLRELRTPRLRLVPVGPDDVDALHALWTDAGVRRFLWDDVVIPREVAAERVERTLAHVAERGYGLWTVHHERRLIGFCGFQPLEGDGEPELLYGLYPEHWGQGLAVEASRAAIEELRRTLAPARVWALADPPNLQSFRVMEKLGMRFHHDGESHGLPARYYVLQKEDP